VATSDPAVAHHTGEAGYQRLICRRCRNPPRRDRPWWRLRPCRCTARVCALRLRFAFEPAIRSCPAADRLRSWVLTPTAGADSTVSATRDATSWLGADKRYWSWASSIWIRPYPASAPFGRKCPEGAGCDRPLLYHKFSEVSDLGRAIARHRKDAMSPVDADTNL